MKSILILLLSLSFLGYSSGYSQQTLSKPEKFFSKIKIRPGTADATLINDYGKKWKVRVTFPENINPDTVKTLIIALHWRGDYDTYKEFNDCLILPGLNHLNSIIVSPEAERQLWSTDNNVEKILSIVANAKKYWNVDSGKIAVVGYSNGGIGSWYYAEHHPDLFSAAIPMAGAYAIDEKIEIPMYVIHGAKDDLFLVSKTKEWVEQTKKAGTNITLKINDKLAHNEACQYIYELKKAGNWLKKIWETK